MGIALLYFILAIDSVFCIYLIGFNLDCQVTKKKLLCKNSTKTSKKTPLTFFSPLSSISHAKGQSKKLKSSNNTLYRTHTFCGISASGC